MILAMLFIGIGMVATVSKRYELFGLDPQAAWDRHPHSW